MHPQNPLYFPSSVCIGEWMPCSQWAVLPICWGAHLSQVCQVDVPKRRRPWHTTESLYFFYIIHPILKPFDYGTSCANHLSENPGIVQDALILTICSWTIFCQTLCTLRKFMATECRWNWALATPRFKQQHEQVILGWLTKCYRRWGLWMCDQFLVLLPGTKFAGKWYVVSHCRSAWCMHLILLSAREPGTHFWCQ